MSTLSIINQSYTLYKSIIQINTDLEKRWRYNLGSSFETSALELLENLIMAKDAPKELKSGYLIRASAKLEICRLKLRLYLELKITNPTKIFQSQAVIEEIGRILGGWLKSLT